MHFAGLYSGSEAIRAQESDVEYAVFDDIAGGIRFFPNYKCWLGGQYQFNVKVLYRDPVCITWGRPAIWLSNSDPRDDVTDDERRWLDGNCKFVYITEPIFHANTQ